MKKITILTIAIAYASIVSFAQTTTTRSAGSFHQIDIAGSFDKMVLKYGATEGIELLGDAANIANVITEVKDNVLQIHAKKGAENTSRNVTLVVTFRNLQKINASGSTDVVIQGTLKGSKFEYNASGSGDISGNFEVSELALNIAGSADAQLSGKANTQKYAVSGSGDIDAGGMKGETADIAISGSGDVTVNISGNVKSHVAGSGQVQNKAAEK